MDLGITDSGRGLPPGRGRSFTRLGGAAALLIGIILLALNLRSPITALAPVIDEIVGDTGLSSAAAGALTGIPVLCFAALTPVAAFLLARISRRSAITASLALILTGTLLRSLPLGLNHAELFAGVALIGFGITLANVAVPMIAQREFPTRVSAVTGAYTATLNVGTMASTAVTGPLASWVGWRWALGWWAILAVIALAWWHLCVHDGGARLPLSAPADHRSGEGSPGSSSAQQASSSQQHSSAQQTASVPRRFRALRSKYTWALVAIFGIQSAAFYGLTAWLPLILQDRAGLSPQGSGLAASLFQGPAIAGALLVPLVLRRIGIRATFAAIAACWLALPLGLLFAPGAWMIFTSSAGVAQAANFVLVFTLIAKRFPIVDHARSVSAAVQSLGYCLAAVAPTLLGFGHEISGQWWAPIAVVAAALGLMSLVGLVLTSPRRTTENGPRVAS